MADDASCSALREGREAQAAVARLVGHGLRVGITIIGQPNTGEAVLQHGDLHHMVHGIAPLIHVGAAQS